MYVYKTIRHSHAIPKPSFEDAILFFFVVVKLRKVTDRSFLTGTTGYCIPSRVFKKYNEIV